MSALLDSRWPERWAWSETASYKGEGVDLRTPEYLLFIAEEAEAIEQFRASLAPRERDIFDMEVDARAELDAAPEGDGAPAPQATASRAPKRYLVPRTDAAARLQTTVKTIASTRTRLTEKVKEWMGSRDANPGQASRPHAARAARRGPDRRKSMGKAWSTESERRSITRAMTPVEMADMQAGYPASRYRRRSAAWGRSTDRQGDAQDTSGERKAA